MHQKSVETRQDKKRGALQAIGTLKSGGRQRARRNELLMLELEEEIVCSAFVALLLAISSVAI